MKITVLSENTARPPLEAEHGLSLLIETKKSKILFDMGQTSLFWSNGKALGVDLEQVDFAVLSHGHYDHGGGLSHFLSHNEKSRVYCSENAFGAFYNGKEKYIGLNPSLKENERFFFARNGMEIGDGIFLFTSEGRKSVFPFETPSLTVLQEGGWVPDPFDHEIYLLVEEAGKRILFSGCAHRGILNLMEWFRPDVFVGGFHLSKFPLDETLLQIGKRLSLFDAKLFTCHCTGVEQFEFLKKENEALSYLSCGDQVII